jgi:hypothetical protein
MFIIGNVFSIRIFWYRKSLCLKELQQTASFSMMGQLPTLQTQLLYCKSCLALFRMTPGRPISRLHTTWLFSVRASYRTYLNNTGSLEELKYTTEQAVDSNDSWSLCSVWMLFFKKLVDIFSICFKAVTEVPANKQYKLINNSFALLYSCHL